MKHKTLSYYRAKSRSLNIVDGVKVNIALMSNYTIKGLKEIIRVMCDEHQINANIYEAEYNQIVQEIIDENSQLRKFCPDITFMMINQKYILGDLICSSDKDGSSRITEIKHRTDDFIELIDMFPQNVTGLLVVSGLHNLTYSPLGVMDEKIEMSVKDVVLYFNEKLKQKFAKHERIFVYDMSAFFTKYGEANIINDKMYYLADIFVSSDYLPYLAEELMGYVIPFCSKNKKCIVLDLDNTLWGGVVGEEGLGGIKLDDKSPGNAFLDFQKYLLALHKRGIILAINSKNNPEDALNVFRNHPYCVLKEEHFAAMRINWQDKAANMKEIADELNIGSDSMLFIDDDPVNRALIREMLPEIEVVDLPEDPALYVKTVKDMNSLNTLYLTEEDYKKGKMYCEQRKRADVKKQYNNLEDFVRYLNLKVKIVDADDFTIPRISQLTKKTNQFNLTTKRYTEEDIKSFASRNDYMVRGVHVTDRFGDYGLAGVFIINKEGKNRWLIDSLLLSCRVLGRFIENVVVESIKKMAGNHNVRELVGVYYPTNKNMQVASFYENCGFSCVNKNMYVLKYPVYEGKYDFVRIES